jgi:hypothetical protein
MKSLLVVCCLLGGVAAFGFPTDAAAGEACPNAAFRGGPSAHLPECRAYEMVSPSYQNGGEVGTLAIAADGSAMLMGGFVGFGNAQSDEGLIGGIYRMTRTGAGWAAQSITPPATQYIDSLPTFASSLDLGTTLWLARGVHEAGNVVNLYAEQPDGAFVEVGPGLPPSAPSGFSPVLEEFLSGLFVVGLSDDASHVLLSLSSSYWPGEEPLEGSALYEYIGTGNSAPIPVGVDDSGHLISRCGTRLGEDESGWISSGEAQHPVSASGKTIFFTAEPCEGGPSVPELFARIDNGEPDAHTVAISEPTKEDCAACDTETGVLAEAHFQGASTDGSKVFFTTTQPLLGGDSSQNLYEYDFDAPAGQRIVRVTGGDTTVSSPVASMTGEPVAISGDGSHVYFVANGVLTTNANSQGAKAVQEAENLYVFESGAGGEGKTAFVTDLCSGPGVSGGVTDSQCPVEFGGEHAKIVTEDADQYLWRQATRARGANVTPDGRYLVMMSYGDLTPGDTSTTQQVFEYDAQTEQLVRVSIGQNGFNDNGNITSRSGNAEIKSPQQQPAGARGFPTSYSSTLSVSADGSDVFFQSTNGLTPQAIDLHSLGESAEGFDSGERFLQQYTENIYEYHSVEGNIADGNVYLISDGEDLASGEGNVEGTGFLGTDESGQDVFFASFDKLTPEDTSEDNRVFDARVEGGFPALPASPECSGDACQGPLATSPTLLSPGSEFQAGGNPPLAASAPAVKAKPLTRAQKLTKALVACRKQPKGKRAACDKQARKKYGPVSKGKAKRATARIGGRS